ncbi:alpha/beta hydrolase [Anoxynatronum buryatiense]|uniref:Acetyl esterase/lipase n=1 Tax=Anoxynatronum buryatiense TaxID=489973 RepID=A0AA45WW78_9CLOT|nr:alpha/beta hydrolase [Anoxynatronum buryatiense]SMP58192.1 Acetyl esterase/lipase [Anoxynatronum buryatiense]
MEITANHGVFHIPLENEGWLDAYLLAEGSTRQAVVICPGGGYQMISHREGKPVAEAFNQAGFHAFVLHYKVAPAPLGWQPLHQLSQAVAEARQQVALAENTAVSGVKVAVCGFSAGGHLAGSLGTLWHRNDLFPATTSFKLHRPDALVLCYPVISARECAHAASFQQLAGPDPELCQLFSLEEQVTDQTPPTFLWHTLADELVPAKNSLLFLEALMKAQVTAELHLYPRGEHGLSLATPAVEQPENQRWADPHVATWFALAVEWLAETL